MLTDIQLVTLMFAGPFLGLAFIWIAATIVISSINPNWMDD